MHALGSARGPGRLQECTTACPARLSAPARRAHRSGPRKAVRTAVRAQGAQAQRADWVTCCARARRRPRTRARVRANACARTGLSVWVTWRTKLRLLPAPPPFPPSGFLSFLFFLLIFFSMNTHRVHLKATLPHFTASVGFLLLRFPLQFKWEKKNNRM